MPQYDIYQDIAERTGGAVFIGIVGPVRTGKSTLIAKLMEHLVLPNITDEHIRARVVDEMPQSGQGKSIMTTQPKFVPDHAVKIRVDDAAELEIRLVDCVGYLVDGAEGHLEEGQPRMVRTPWFDYDIPFEEAAEIGTRKVIADHASIGIVLTTDGSIAQIPRESYVPAEEKVIGELKALGKPFIIVLNSANPSDPATQRLQHELEEKYASPVLLVDVMNFTKENLTNLLSSILYEFPIRNVDIDISKWVLALPQEHYILRDVLKCIEEGTRGIYKMRDYPQILDALKNCGYIKKVGLDIISLGSGNISLSASINDDLFYQVLGEECGCEIADERHLFSITKELVHAKKHYDRLKSAINTVKQTGYGIVPPVLTEFQVEKPEIFDQNGKYGVRIRAEAPTLHMIRVDVDAEVSPIIGTEAQAEEFVSYLLQAYNEDPSKIWDTDIFGKRLCDIMTDGLRSKVQNIPEEAQDKLQNTLERVVNEGDGGMLFILL